MSKRPPKKSDRNKEWMRKRDSKMILIQPERHLIVTEGEKTEPLYFMAIKDEISKTYREKIDIEVIGQGDNTVSLYEKAKAIAEKNLNVYKHVWVVYDTDDFPAEKIDLTARLCEESTTEETVYHATWSNQCIELWYLLHFGFLQSDIDRKEYFEKLNDILRKIGEGNYTKNREDMFKILRPYLQTAIQNAVKLDENNNGKLPSESAPGTKVYELLSHLLKYL